jgi:hypothetical protein
MTAGLLILIFIILVLVLAVSGPAGVAGVVSASRSAVTGAAGGVARAALPGIPVVYGSCAAAYAFLRATGAGTWRSALLLVAAAGVGVALGRRTGVAAAVALLGAVAEAWSDSREAGCIAGGHSLAAYGGLVILTLACVGAWSVSRGHVSTREFAEAVALGAFGVVYLLRYLTYPGSQAHVQSPVALGFIAVTAAVAVGWLAGTAATMVKAAVAATVLLLGGAWCLVSVFGPCAAFNWADWLVPLAAAIPGALIARFSSARW